MRTTAPETNPSPEPHQRRAAGFRIAGILVVVLLVGALLLAANVPGLDQQPPSARTGRYLRSGQLQADARTLFAAFRYVMDTDDGPSYDTIPLVRNAATAMIEREPKAPVVNCEPAPAALCVRTNGCAVPVKEACNS